jgi:hypothetical protein
MDEDIVSELSFSGAKGIVLCVFSESERESHQKSQKSNDRNACALT